jgi:uncharacterized membrane protein
VTDASSGQRDSSRTGSERSELLISGLLRYGVLTSLTVVLLGTLLSFIHHPAYSSSAEALNRLTSPAQGPQDLSTVARDVLAGHGQAVVTFGLLLLIGIPVARVGLSLIVFAQTKDRRFVAITAVVFALLLLSFAIGAAD